MVKVQGGVGGCALWKKYNIAIQHDLSPWTRLVDLMLLHYVDTFEETLAAYEAMENMVATGKAKAIGVSNFNASMIENSNSARIKLQ